MERRSKLDKKRIIAGILGRLSQRRLEEFRQYTQELEAKFNTDKNKLSAAYDETIKGLNEDEITEITEYFAEDFHFIEEIYIGMYRKSTLVSLYSFLENALNTLCRKLYSINNYPVELEVIRGEGIVRAREYLEKLSKIDFSQLNNEWCNLLSLNKLRNCIVHCEGNIKLSNSLKKLKNIINNRHDLSLRNEKYIKIDRDYIDFSITQISNFLEKLYQQAFPK